LAGVRRSKLRSDVVRATSLTQMDKISGLLVVARDGGEARWRFPSLQFRAAWYDKEFDRRNARSRAAREDVRPLIAGKADTMPANSRLSLRDCVSPSNWDPIFGEGEGIDIGREIDGLPEPIPVATSK
jgi:hypothetical protein